MLNKTNNAFCGLSMIEYKYSCNTKDLHSYMESMMSLVRAIF